MKFEDVLYRKTLQYKGSSDGHHDLLKYKDEDLEVWVSYDNDHRGYSFDGPVQCTPYLPFFIRKNGSKKFDICEPEELVEEDGKIKYIGRTVV